MKNQEFHFLLEKYDSEEITNEELERLKQLTKSDPVLKEEFEKHRQAILGIKSQALREVLREVMEEEDKSKIRTSGDPQNGD